MKDKTTAALLAILLGGLGIHKFYLGKGALGLLYLVFCWTFIPAIIGLIEGILLLLMSKQDFDLDYNPLSLVQIQQMAARATNPQVPSYPQYITTVAQLQAKPTMGRVETLQALQALRASGVLTEAEFEREKAMLLASNRS